MRKYKNARWELKSNMKFYITGTISKQDDWVLKYIYSHGPIPSIDEPAVLDYADLFRKPTFRGTRTGYHRCKPFEKKLSSMWERGMLVREKKPSFYSEKESVWHYGLPGRDPGELFTTTLTEDRHDG